MARKVYTIAKREWLAKKAQDEFKNKSRAKQLYNYIYKHSTYYRVSFVLRALTLILSLYVLNFNTLFTTTSSEIITDTRIEEFQIGKKTNNPENRDIIISTKPNNEYAIGYVLSETDMYFRSDTIDVVKNIFGKKSYIVNTKTKHRNQLSKLRRFDNFLMFIALSTFLSLCVFDAFEFLYRVYIRVIFILDILTILFYFIM